MMDFEGRWNFLGLYPHNCGIIENCDMHYWELKRNFDDPKDGYTIYEIV